MGRRRDEEKEEEAELMLEAAKLAGRGVPVVGGVVMAVEAAPVAAGAARKYHETVAETRRRTKAAWRGKGAKAAAGEAFRGVGRIQKETLMGTTKVAVAAGLSRRAAEHMDRAKKNAGVQSKSVTDSPVCPVHRTKSTPWRQFGPTGFGHYGAYVCWACREREEAEKEAKKKEMEAERRKASPYVEWDVDEEGNLKYNPRNKRKTRRKARRNSDLDLLRAEELQRKEPYLSWQRDLPDEGSARLYQDVLAHLRAIHWLAWTAHWAASGPNYYGDHLLLQRLYAGEGGRPAIEPAIDTLGEKMVAHFGVDSVNPAVLGAKAQSLVEQAAAQGSGRFAALLTLEQSLQAAIRVAWSANQASGDQMSLGIDDYLMGLANERETAIYLIKRRLAGGGA